MANVPSCAPRSSTTPRAPTDKPWHKNIGVLETRLVMMRSDCVDHWRAT